MSEAPHEQSVAKQSQVTNFDLYKLYSEENHKYNSIIWQFPVAVIGVNVLAFDKVGQGIWFIVLFLMLNLVLTAFLAKHVYHQGCFTKALAKLADGLRSEDANLKLVEFKKDDCALMNRFKSARASVWLVYSMVLFNLIVYGSLLFNTLTCPKPPINPPDTSASDEKDQTPISE